MVAYVNSPTRSVAICNELVCKITNTQEIEASRATCLLHFRASLHRCSAHPCTVESSLLPCMLFLTLETPPTTTTTTVSPAFQLQYLPCAAMLRLKRDGWSDTTAAPFLLWARWSWAQFMRAQAWLLPHTSCVPCLSSQESCLRPLFQADLGTDGEPCPSRSHLCSNSSNKLDFVVNCARVLARGPSVTAPIVCIETRPVCNEGSRSNSVSGLNITILQREHVSHKRRRGILSEQDNPG